MHKDLIAWADALEYENAWNRVEDYCLLEIRQHHDVPDYLIPYLSLKNYALDRILAGNLLLLNDDNGVVAYSKRD